MPMDEKIINLVASLRAHGFPTVMSCEGHLDRNTGGPYVIIVSPESEQITKENDSPETRALAKNVTAIAANKLFTLLEEFYSHKPIKYSLRIVIDTIGPNAYRIWCNGSSILPEREDIYIEEKSKLLESYQREMERFSVFMKNKI